MSASTLPKLQHATGNSSRESWGMVVGNTAKKLGGIFPHDLEAKTAPEIRRAMVIAIKDVQRKRASEAAEVTGETVKSWIANENAPRFVETVRLARKVPKIRKALYELIEGREIDPQLHHKIFPLLDALHTVAQSGGEMGELAYRTLKEFSTGHS